MDDLTRRLRLRLLCSAIARAEAVREARTAREVCARIADAEAQACRDAVVVSATHDEHNGWISRATEAEEIAAAIRRRG